jgi:hypothetical protein
VPRILVPRESLWVFQFREDCIGRDACEVRGEKLRALLGVTIGTVEGVAGLNLGLRIFGRSNQFKFRYSNHGESDMCFLEILEKESHERR